jgi:hypothetical protein
VTKDEALARVLKLREMTEARGASANEARVAAAKAERLINRFRLDRRDTHRPRPSERRQDRRVFVPDWPPKWSFDVRTGEASPNVKVHRHNSVRDWKIEIDPSFGADERWAMLSGKGKRGSLHG